jgi:hypothetical protein
MLNFSNVKKYKSYLSRHNNKGLFHSSIAEGVMTKAIIEFSDEDLAKIQKSWDETKKENDKIHKANESARTKVLKQIEEFCFDLGYPTYVKGHGDTIVGEHAEFKSMLKQLSYRMPASESPPTPAPKAIRSMNEDLKPSTKCNTLQEFVAEMRPILAKQEQKKLEQELAVAQAKAKSVEEFATAADKIKARIALRKLNETDKAKWLASNYPANTPIAIDCCDDCDKWLFGHKTCSCGRKYIEYRVVGEAGKWELKFYSTFAPMQPLIPDFSDVLAVKRR